MLKLTETLPVDPYKKAKRPAVADMEADARVNNEQGANRRREHKSRADQAKANTDKLTPRMNS